MKAAFRSGAALALIAAAGCATTAAPATRKSASPAKPLFVKADIEGAAPAALDQLLGAPALTRREGKGEYRRYAFAECALIVILYPDESGAVAVRELDAAEKVSGGQKPDLDHCLAIGPAKPLKSG